MFAIVHGGGIVGPCHRCRQPVADGEQAEQIFTVRLGGVTFYRLYHEKCYPPVLFNRRQHYRQRQEENRARWDEFGFMVGRLELTGDNTDECPGT